MTKMTKIAPSSMAIFLSPTYRKRPNFGLLGSFFAIWDHFLGVRSHFFSKVLKEGITFCDFGIIFWGDFRITLGSFGDHFGTILETKLINFDIENIEIETDKIRSAQIPELQKLHKVDLSQYKIKDKRKILRNCVHYKLGEHILKQAISKVSVSQ